MPWCKDKNSEHVIVCCFAIDIDCVFRFIEVTIFGENDDSNKKEQRL